MLFTDLTQWTVLALMLVVGWLFGFASNGGGRKWRARYDDERAAHARTRTEADARVRDAEAEAQRAPASSPIPSTQAQSQASPATLPPLERR